MKTKLKFVYDVRTEVLISYGDFLTMDIFGKQHYDYKCRAACTVWDGLVRQIDNLFAVQFPGVIRDRGNGGLIVKIWLDASEVDLLCKIVENTGPFLCKRLYKILTALNKEYLRVNRVKVTP